MLSASDFETVIGLEIHAQLKTRSKLFSGDSISYGEEPNTQVSPITLAHPGTLPMLNKEAIKLAVRLGLAVHAEIRSHNYFARKNYFYPDLPKGYQVSQHTTPVCEGGWVNILTATGNKKIALNRIHLEEDAGKSLHDQEENFSSIDFNRAGTPLVEIVTEPVLSSAEEAFLFVTAIRKLVRYLDVCDGNMEQGSLRCDANVSVRRRGDKTLGTKVEIKNLNSIRNVRRAIELESNRLINILIEGGKVIQETRSYDAGNNTSFPTREKEDADDYRYFPEPDLAPFVITSRMIDEIRSGLTALPEERIARYEKELGLSSYDAGVLTEERNFSDYFEQLISHTSEYKAAANWMLGPVKSWLNSEQQEIESFPISPAQLAKLILLVSENKISFGNASGAVFRDMLMSPEKEPLTIAEELNLLQQGDENEIAAIVSEVIAGMPDKLKEYKKGKKGLVSLFVGAAMKKTRGKADPKLVNETVNRILNQL